MITDFYMENFICSKCLKQSKRQCLHYKGSNGSNAYLDIKNRIFFGNICEICRDERRKNYAKNHAISCKNYEKTPKGYLMRMYRNMLSRVKGIQYKKAHLYKGLDILSKQEFYEWALNNKNFKMLLKNYKKSNYQQRLAPSIDRIDSSKGYTLDNMRFLTHSKNSSLTNKNKN